MKSLSGTPVARFVVGVLYLTLLTQWHAVNALVDLSQPWTLGSNYNQNKLYCTLQAAMQEQLVGYLVIQDGSIVAEGYKTGSSSADLNPAFSATKSWSSMIVGLLVDAGLLQLNTTLGQVFADDDVWLDIVDADEKKTLTLQALLTFTSGLSERFAFQVAVAEQETLQGVLNATSFDSERRGTYEYLQTNHILSRIIYQVSGKTPLEMATTESDAFAAMGLQANVDYTWDTFGGIEGSAFGMHLNVRTLAKLGLLYLQEGYAAPDTQPVVSPTWVSASVTNQLDPGVVPDNNPLYSGYGYQWYTNNDASYAVVGGGGQMVIVYPNEKIVLAVMTTFDQITIQQATLQSVQLVQLAADNFDAISQTGTCVGDGEEVNIETSAPTTEDGKFDTAEPTSSPSSSGGSAGSGWSKLSGWFSLPLLVLLVSFYN